MRINITVRNMMSLSPSVANYVNKKVGKLDRYFGDDIEAQVRLSMERHRFTCEITIPLPGEILRAEETSGDMYVSIDSVLSKLEGQIRKHRTRLAKRMKRDADPIEVFLPEEETMPQVVRTKRFRVDAMDVDEAISQMEMLGHTFFLFRDKTSNQICLVYTRQDGNYGVLIPE
ncbi:MAG: ribosome hibernation-promoting factor, HPF/YfiA family [Candidatus Spyradocola sp.]|jgi:putative sigma-54 modulation protein